MIDIRQSDCRLPQTFVPAAASAAGTLKNSVKMAMLMSRVLRTIFGTIFFLSTTILLSFSMPVWAGSGIEIVKRPLGVHIDGRPYNLDVLIGKPTNIKKGRKLPVALISHGAAGREPPRHLTLALLSGWVRDFSARGYLAVAVMRRSYGDSDGPAYQSKDTCEAPNPKLYFKNQADDLAAALQAIAHRKDADMGTVLGIGHSAGGGAMLALAARADVTISAVINVSGGTFRYRPGKPLSSDVFEGCERYRTAVDDALGNFAEKLNIPTLWLYAKNDPFFPPPLAQHWMNVWHENGGKGQLKILPDYEPNGHRLFIQPKGQEVLWPEIDEFLRAQALPAWNDTKFTELRRSLGPRQRKALDKFLASGLSMKAMAVPVEGNTKSYWFTGAHTLKGARAEAEGLCRQESGQDCVVIVENFDPTGRMPRMLKQSSHNE
ncbi:alpha/beta hydrolase [Aestuariispira ectoiniformans]|uniref:alpha/beta hydrolase n=1 Tax=Aestuariispira ectoiniformans TaxID=2775080 RepID=UPI00223BFCDF|nr:CocE/NonD family hydrolase [Aestuariispira ectoiniformans]